MTRKDEAGSKGAARFLARPLIVAVAVAILIAIYISFIAGEPPTAVAPADLDTRPPAAPADIIENPSAADLRPNILDAGEGPPPAASIEELDIPDHIDPSVVEPGPPGAQPEDQ
jgi:hypothetical protein